VKKRKLIFLLLFIFYCSSPTFADDKALQALVLDSGDARMYPGSQTVVLFDSLSVKVMESGLSYTTSHRLVKVLTPGGAIELAVQKFDYDPLSADVTIQHVRIFRKNGKIENVPLDSTLDYAAPARMIYWGARQKMLPVGRLQVGDALETKDTRKGFTYALLGGESGENVPATDERFVPPMRGHFYDIVPFWSAAATLIKSYTLSIPADKPLQYQVYNGELTSWVHLNGDETLYHWEKKDIKPFSSESDMVAASDVAPKLLVSTSPDWYAKSRWFYSVNENYGSFETTPELSRKVAELIKNCKSDVEKVTILTHWAAEEIRYSGLTMGPGEGYTLHKGAMTFRDRCGVCKDKAGMLVTLLRAAGFESYAAMTMAGSRIDRIPADQFNHSVTVWKRGPDDYVLLDPTWVPGVRELWSSAEQQQEFLMGLPEGADLKTTPVSAPENHYFQVRGTSDLTSDGTLTGTVVIQAEGQTDARLRRNFLRNFKALWQGVFDQAIFDASPFAQIISLEYGDPYDISKALKITYRYRIPKYAELLDDRMVFTPVVARFLFGDRITHSFLSMKNEMETRKYPFATRCSEWIDFQETVRLPDGFDMKYKPDFYDISGDAADFSAGYQVSNRNLEFKESVRLKKRIYPAADWPQFKETLDAMSRVIEAPIILVKR
jgi:hypothetical protein